jgi:hypothetical protein
MFYVSVMVVVGKPMLRLESVVHSTIAGVPDTYTQIALLNPTVKADMDEFTLRLLGYPDATKPVISVVNTILSASPTILYKNRYVSINPLYEIRLAVDELTSIVAIKRRRDSVSQMYTDVNMDAAALYTDISKRVLDLKIALDVEYRAVAFTLGEFDI